MGHGRGDSDCGSLGQPPFSVVQHKLVSKIASVRNLRSQRYCSWGLSRGGPLELPGRPANRVWLVVTRPSPSLRRLKGIRHRAVAPAARTLYRELDLEPDESDALV